MEYVQAELNLINILSNLIIWLLIRVQYFIMLLCLKISVENAKQYHKKN